MLQKLQVLQANPEKYVGRGCRVPRLWHGTTRAQSRNADRMVGGSVRAQILLPRRQSSTDERMTMLCILSVVLLLLWLLGVVSSYTRWIHPPAVARGRRARS